MVITPTFMLLSLIAVFCEKLAVRNSTIVFAPWINIRLIFSPSGLDTLMQMNISNEDESDDLTNRVRYWFQFLDWWPIITFVWESPSSPLRQWWLIHAPWLSLTLIINWYTFWWCFHRTNKCTHCDFNLCRIFVGSRDTHQEANFFVKVYWNITTTAYDN